MDADASLPEEMIVEIVMRLPMKSVGRCRCVSTRWRSLFSDPQFAKSQFQVSPKHQSLIFQFDNGELKTLGFDLSDTASFEKESLGPRVLEAPFDHISLRFMGSCNGLVAARDFSHFSDFDGKHEGVFIWNPSTGFFKKLPARRFPTRRGEFGDDDIIVGFGYVSGSDEYKLVMGAEIFSSKTESWKPIEVPGGNFGVEMPLGVLCKGALHWTAYPDKHQGQMHLYAFDLEKEEFSIMKLPSALHTQLDSLMCDFGVTCEGCLFVLAESPVQDCGSVVEFWVMREYGNSDFWTRSFILKSPIQDEWRDKPLPIGAISVMEASAFLSTVCLEEEEEKLMSTIYYCNKEESTVIYAIESCLWLGFVYEESLCCLA